MIFTAFSSSSDHLRNNTSFNHNLSKSYNLIQLQYNQQHILFPCHTHPVNSSKSLIISTPNAHPNAEEPETANADGDNAGDDTGETEAEAASDETEAEPEAPGGAGETNNTENKRRRDGTAKG